MRYNEIDFKGKRLTCCLDCGFILPEKGQSSCTRKHLDVTFPLVQTTTQGKSEPN